MVKITIAQHLNNFLYRELSTRANELHCLTLLETGVV